MTFIALTGLAAAAGPLLAEEKAELTFAAAAFHPSGGQTSWSATGELLFPIGHYLVAGPSIGLFDTGPMDGGSFGIAAEVNLSGPFVGGSLNRPTGDAADQADYTAEARAGFKFGGKKGFAKIYASQTWSRLADGSTVDPDGTSIHAGLGLRF